jgi:WXG100 family type VII secretion target
MASQVQVNYDDMRNIIQRMKSEQAEVLNLLKATKAQVDYIHGNQWIGRGSEKFFSEMEQRYLPALQRLANALGTAAEKAQKVVDTIRQADEGTKPFFTRLQ